MLPLSVYEQIERLAYQEKLTISDVVRLAIWDFLQGNKGEEDFRQN
jgi:hypothetical protein